VAGTDWVEVAATADWSAIRFLYEFHSQPIDKGARWRVRLAPEPNKYIWVEFRFEKPLPPFEVWSTPRSLGLPQ
jgi:hypothetical protein